MKTTDERILVKINGHQEACTLSYDPFAFFGPDFAEKRKQVIGEFLKFLRSDAQRHWDLAKKKREEVVVLGPLPTQGLYPGVKRVSPIQLAIVVGYSRTSGTNRPTPGGVNNISTPRFASFSRCTRQLRYPYSASNPQKSEYCEPIPTSWSDFRNGVDKPGWRKLIAAGGNATTPMTAFRGRVKSTPGFVEAHWESTAGDGTKQIIYDAFSGHEVLTMSTKLTDSTLLDAANMGSLAKLHKKIGALQRSADVGETLAEYRQALRMIGGPLAGMRELIQRSDKRGQALLSEYQKQMSSKGQGSSAARNLSKESAARDLTRAVGKTWLEFWFGWYPLAKDLEAAVKAVETYRNTVTIQSIKSSFKTDKLVVDSITRSSLLNYLYVIRHNQQKLTCTVRYQIGINPKKVATGDYFKNIGLSRDRFIPTVYAVIPYSWLFDYFTRFNVVIDALCADLEMLTWTCKTVRWENSNNMTTVPDASRTASLLGQDLKGYFSSPFFTTVERLDVDRSIPSTLIPVPVLQIPKSWKPYANIVALLASRVARTPLRTP